MDTNAFYTKEEIKRENGNDDSKAESILSIVAYWLLIIGIAAALFVLFAFAHEHFLMVGVVYSIVILILSVVSWAVLKVFVNISMTLKEINNKIR